MALAVSRARRLRGRDLAFAARPRRRAQALASIDSGESKNAAGRWLNRRHCRNSGSLSTASGRHQTKPRWQRECNPSKRRFAMDIGLLILRLVVGLTLAAHGSQKLFGWVVGYGIAGTGGI